MKIWSKRWVSYITAFTLITLVCVYILDIPTIISQSPSLVHEYYYKNAVLSFFLDIVLIAVYIAVAMYVAQLCRIESYAFQTVVVAIVSIVISSTFMFYFQHRGDSTLFFVRWFKQVGFKAVLYDMGLVSLTYITMIAIHHRLFDS